IYFNKETSELNVPQSALLVGMLKATTSYNPVKNPEKSLERRNVVLSQLNKYKYISAEDLAVYKATPIKLEIGNDDEGSENDSYLRTAVDKYLEKWCEENDYNLYEDGLKIYTTIDSK